MSTLRRIEVALGARRYDILIGRNLIATTGARIAACWPSVRVGIVTDENVARHHLTGLQQSLAAAGSHAGTIVLPPGEPTKSFSVLCHLCERILGLGLERNDMLVALGGGVIGDLTGFAAAISRRGMRFVQVPTTLLAQVDSSVGGKTGINTAQGKNLVGAFHQPSLVIADIDALATLPPREMRAGYAEVVKYGLLGDAAFFDWLEVNGAGLLAGDPERLAYAVEVSCRIKAGIVARDETETGERALLNLGHTFGHAIEAWAGYSDRLLHGEAVAIGMGLAFALSEDLGLAAPGTTARVRTHLERAGLPTRIAQVPAGADGRRPDVPTLLALMAQDKKVVAGKQTLILAHAIGAAFVSREVSRERLTAFLASCPL